MWNVQYGYSGESQSVDTKNSPNVLPEDNHTFHLSLSIFFLGTLLCQKIVTACDITFLDHQLTSSFYSINFIILSKKQILFIFIWFFITCLLLLDYNPMKDRLLVYLIAAFIFTV